MKPSTRILEIFGGDTMNLMEVGKAISAIIKYLDEQHEQMEKARKGIGETLFKIKPYDK